MPEGQPAPPFFGLLVWNFVAWYLWAALFHLIRKLAQEYPLDGGNRNYLKNLPIHLVSAVLFMGVHVVALVSIQWLLDSPRAETIGSFGAMIDFYIHALFDTQVTVYLLLLVAAHMVNYYERMRAEEIRNANFRTQIAELQLASLRMQLNPHFLFNTLNAITELIHTDPDAAEKMVMNLSELLRSTLATINEQKVPLQKEIEFIDQYLEIQKMRFGDRLKISRFIPSSLLNASVPNMVLQPIVENAVGHGIAPLAAGGSITIAAEENASSIRLTVTDDGVGLTSGQDIFSGIGLRNTRDRLIQLYGERQRLLVESQATGGVRVTIEIPHEQ